MAQALYRTHRSRSLSEVVGQEHITNTLAQAIAAGRISHAYLFTGPRGTGKTSVARILAHEINQLPYTDTQQLDIIEIDAASNRRIDDVRDLREKVHIAPVHARYKVYIIDEVHMLTTESFNALLKTLEEPPAHVVFILATTEVHKLPATIISRTQRYTFKPGTPEQIVAHLKNIANKENINIQDDALALIAEHGDGSYRDSLSLLDQIIHTQTGKTITAHDVSASLGIPPIEQLKALAEAALKGEQSTVIRTINELEKQGTPPATTALQLCKILVHMAEQQPKAFQLSDALLEVPHAYHPGLKLLTVLASFATPEAKPPVTYASQVVSPASVAIASKPAPQQTVAHTTKPAKHMPPKPETQNDTATQQPLSELSPEQWQQIMHILRQKNPHLFAVLKRAAPSVHQDALLLAFKFALHSKKLEDPKQKAALSAIIKEVLHITPRIELAVNKSATPPIITDDPTIASVSEIMGGGELM